MTDDQILDLAETHLHYGRTIDAIAFARALLSASKPAVPEYTYETYTGQCGWLVVSKEEYEQSEYRKRRTPIAAAVEK